MQKNKRAAIDNYAKNLEKNEDRKITLANVLDESPYRDILCAMKAFGGLTRRQLYLIFVKKKKPYSAYKIFDKTYATNFHGTKKFGWEPHWNEEKKIKYLDEWLKKFIKDKTIEPDSISTSGLLDYYLNKMRKPPLDILWIDTKNTKSRKGIYRLKKTQEAFQEEITGETIRQANKNAFDNFFSRNEILDMDDIIQFPIQRDRQDENFFFHKNNYILYGLNRKDLSNFDKKILRECFTSIEKKIKKVEEIQIKISDRKLKKVVDDLRKKTGSKNLKNWLKKEDSIKTLQAYAIRTTMIFNRIATGNRYAQKKYGADAEQWLLEEKRFLLKSAAFSRDEINDIMKWIGENHRYFLKHDLYGNIAFSRYMSVELGD